MEREEIGWNFSHIIRDGTKKDNYDVNLAMKNKKYMDQINNWIHSTGPNGMDVKLS